MSAWSFIGSAVNFNSGSSLFIDASSTLSVNAGDLIVVRAVNTPSTATFSDLRINTNPQTGETLNITNQVQSGDRFTSIWFLALNTGTITYGVDWSATATFRGITVEQYRATGATITLDAGVTGSNGNTSSVQPSGVSNWVTTGVDDLITCGGFSGNQNAWSNMLIDTAAATNTIASGGDGVQSWSGVVTSPGTMSATANKATLGAPTNDSWAASGFAFTATPNAPNTTGFRQGPGPGIGPGTLQQQFSVPPRNTAITTIAVGLTQQGFTWSAGSMTFIVAGGVGFIQPPGPGLQSPFNLNQFQWQTASQQTASVSGSAILGNGSFTWSAGILGTAQGTIANLTQQSFTWSIGAMSPNATGATLTVPNVVGMYVYDAQLAILQAGFFIWPPVPVQNASVPLGTVLTQSPSAGTIYPIAAQVPVVITVAETPQNLPPQSVLSLGQ